MRIAPLMIATFLLAGCSMQNNSFISQQPLQVQKETVQKDFPSDKVSKAELNEIADDINHRAQGPITIKVDYALKQPLHSSQRVAEAQGNHIKAYLNQQEVKRQINVQLEPVKDAASVNTIHISYDALKALPPKDCNSIALADADQYTHGSDSDYRYGCSGDQYLSRMIARPGDLLGNETNSVAESQRLGKSTDNYNAGERATPPDQEGLSASKVYDSK